MLADGLRPVYALPGHHHAELIWRNRRVHLETTAADVGGPGGTTSEVRVYVDGALEGRSILLGPVMAAVGSDALHTITPVRWTSMETLNVELWERRTPTRRRP